MVALNPKFSIRVSEALLKIRKVLGNTFNVRQEPEWIIQYVLNISPKEMLLSLGNNLDFCYVKSINTIVERLLMGEPLNRILGVSYFIDRNYKVFHNVFSPRLETEFLVQLVKKTLTRKGGSKIQRVLECGSGTGIISLALANVFKDIIFSSWDLSKDSYRNSMYNLSVQSLTNVEFFLGDFFEAVAAFSKEKDLNVKQSHQRYFLVSNPPYIPSKDIASLDENVRCYDPSSALDGGIDGISYYRRFAMLDNLFEGIAMEIGCNQRCCLDSLFSMTSYSYRYFFKDLFGMDRFAVFLKEPWDDAVGIF